MYDQRGRWRCVSDFRDVFWGTIFSMGSVVGFVHGFLFSFQTQCYYVRCLIVPEGVISIRLY